MRKQQGKWPVLFLTFADIKSTTFEDTKASLNQLITKLYNEYDEMLQDGRFTERDRSMFMSVGPKMDAVTAARSLQNPRKSTMRQACWHAAFQRRTF